MSSFGYGTEYKIQGKWVATDSFDADYSGEPKSIEANDPAAPKLTFATAGEEYYPQVMYTWHENQVRWEINGEVFTLHVLSGPGMLERPYQKYVSIENPKTRSYKRYKLVEITEEEEEENNEWYQSVTDQIWCNDSQWESFPTKDRIDNVDATTLPADENGFVIKGSALYRYDEGIGGPVVNIPDGIKRIKSRAFSECHSITHVHVPNSVGSLGDACFSGCENLVSIRLPEGLKCIGDDMFSGCAKLQEINLPSTLTSIGRDSFALCGALEEVVFPEALTIISSRAFAAAKSLRKIKLNSGLKKIEFAAFNNCTALTELHIPASVKDIGVLAFDGCTGIKEIVVEDGNEVYYSKNNCLFADKILVLACDNSLVPDDGSVEIIGSDAFSNCKAIESIVLPEAMTAIERNAFSGCTSLKSIQLPRSMSNGYGDFRRNVCGDGLFRGCSSLEYFEIPDWMTEIPEDMFKGCESLKEIKIPDFVTKIGSRAFDGCRSLTELVIPKGVTQIAGEWARTRHNGEFIAGCSSLKRLAVEEGNPTYHSVDNCIIETATGMLFAILENGVIPTDGSITAIGENAFCACTNLTEIALPEGITTIGGNAFSRISNLKKINIPQSVNEIGPNVFFGIMEENRHDAVEEENGVYYVGNWALGIVKKSKSADRVNIDPLDKSASDVGKSGHAPEDITIREGTVGICNSAFSNSTILSVSLPSSLKYICDNAFFSCERLTSISIPEGVKEIGNYAFNACIGLESIILCDGLVRIGGSAFNYCNKLQSVVIPKTVKYIGDDAFRFCKGIQTLVIPDIEIEIGRDAFGYCGDIPSVDVPERILAMLTNFGSTDGEDDDGTENLEAAADETNEGWWTPDGGEDDGDGENPGDSAGETKASWWDPGDLPF